MNLGSLFQAISFLTRLPVPSYRYSEADWQKSAAFYPVVGALLGLILWGAAFFLPVLFSEWLSAVLLLVLWVYLTGGLHLDGWMDLADGLGSHRPRERVLEIMKDSRVGAMGVLAAFLLLLVKMVSIHDVLMANHPSLFLLPPVISRLVLVCAMRFWPYSSKNGIGQGLRKGVNGWCLFAGFWFVALLAWVADEAAGLIVFGMSLILGLGWIHRVYRKLDGLTGDCYGAAVEWTEAVVLIAIILAGRI